MRQGTQNAELITHNSPDGASRYAHVAVLAQLGRAGGLFTYAVPHSLAPLIGPGSLVRVPFSNREFQAVVCSLSASTDLPRVRHLTELLDPVPAVTPHQLHLARWIADYYAAPMSDVLAAMLPPGLGRKTVYALEPAVEANGAHPRPARLSEEQRLVLERVRETGRVLLDDIQRDLAQVDVERVVQSLVRRKLLMKIAELAPPRVSARKERLVSVTKEGTVALRVGKSLGRAPRQRELVEHLVRHGPSPAPMLSRIFPGASAPIAALERKGFVQVEERHVSRSPIDPDRIEVTQALHLSFAQQRAYDRIARSIRMGTSKVFLLHGVTGSGKTEVYLQAVAETIAHGRAAIVMVPEISLTPQAVARFSGRFPGRVAVLHSRLSSGERVDEWQRIRHGEVDVVVGPRSALFAPFQHIGLVVVDEEHDPSYKQDASPRYNARDAAAVLGRLTGATVVFGSATPDVGTYHAALAGRIELLELPNRPVWKPTSEGSNHPPRTLSGSARPMPPVEVVDLRQELKSGNRGIFSNALVEAMNRTLAAREQALLFLNRRGSATVVLCRDCGFVARCPHCDIPFTYHAAATRLMCHRCDKRTVSPRFCPACRGPRIRYLGIGTQRVEEEVQRVFPNARVLRWDRDVTAGKDAHDRILQRFARLEADVLVGTQMIAKGLDFPRVTLVGVISADTGLHLPDFRAPERSFQLLTQVAGRAGRALLPSSVIVQTYTPDHYAIQAAKDHDYKRFYREETSFRRAARYPPFARLVRFVYSADQEAHCRQSAQNLRDILERAVKQEARAEVEIIGPAPCFVARTRNRYYWQLLVRSATAPALSRKLHRLLDYVPPGWAIDVDPVDLL